MEMAICAARVRQGAHVVFVVVVHARVFEVDDSDDFALVDERNGEFGTGLGVLGDVAWILADVWREDGLALLGCGSDDAFAEADVAFAGYSLAVAGGEAVLELFGALVPEQDGEHLEVDDAFEEMADAFEQVVEVEDAGDLAGDLVQNGEGLRLAGDAGVKAGILDGDGHARGDQFEQALVLGGEVSRMSRIRCR